MNNKERFIFSKVDDLQKTMKAVLDGFGIPDNQAIERINTDALFKGFSFVCHIDECECLLANHDLWADGDNIIIAERLLERFGKMKSTAERYDRIIHQPRQPEQNTTGETVDGMKPLTSRQVADRTLLIALGSQLEQMSKVLEKAIGPRCPCGWRHNEALTAWEADGIERLDINSGTNAHRVLCSLHQEALEPLCSPLEREDLGLPDDCYLELSEIFNKHTRVYKALVSTNKGLVKLKTPAEGKADLEKPKKKQRSKKV